MLTGEEFFQKHQHLLEKNYPGLKLPRFLDELYRFLQWPLRRDFLPQSPGDAFQDQGINLRFFYEKVLQGTPLEYINKEGYFYQSFFDCDERALIPRSETELLVDKALSFLKEGDKVLDLGTGTGAIGLTLLQHFKLKMTLSDIDEGALCLAKQNALKLRYTFKGHSTLSFVQSNLFEQFDAQEDDRFDMIISNPPYIKKSQVNAVHPQVQKYEPSIALFIEDSEYNSWFENLFRGVHQFLNKRGYFFMEGHEDNLDQLKEMGLKYFKNIKIEKDYLDAKRFLIAQKD